MRIALVPLDSRPVNALLPVQLGRVGRAEVLTPPRELLGSLHRPADSRALLDWLMDVAAEAHAIVLSWDALVYGGLVQSRAQGQQLAADQLSEALKVLDWSRLAGYLYITVPRLGSTVGDAASHATHAQVADYFRCWGAAKADGSGTREQAALDAAAAALGAHAIAAAWSLRRRNQQNALEALRLAAELGLRSCHVAVEDNAPHGPHLDELDELRRASLTATRLAQELHPTAQPPRFTFFDGADECAALLVARAVLDGRGSPVQPVHLSLFPGSPGIDRYTGRYESHTLEDGVRFLSRLLDLPLRGDADAQWLVCYGTQPQPDVFERDPGEVFSNPRLLPDALTGEQPLYVADLAACNGGNPQLAARLGRLAPGRVRGISAWNTNFNALGTSAAQLALGMLPDADRPAEAELLALRLADDYAYQSLARPRILSECAERGLNPFDFGAEGEAVRGEFAELAEAAWAELLESPARELMIPETRARNMAFAFPWHRAFETECTLERA